MNQVIYKEANDVSFQLKMVPLHVLREVNCLILQPERRTYYLIISPPQMDKLFTDIKKCYRHFGDTSLAPLIPTCCYTFFDFDTKVCLVVKPAQKINKLWNYFMNCTRCFCSIMAQLTLLNFSAYLWEFSECNS